MTHVKADDLYAIFYELARHHAGEASLGELPEDEELDGVIRRLRRDSYRVAPAPEHALKSGAIKSWIVHAVGCAECRNLICEDGPEAKRLASAGEIKADKETEAAELEGMKRMFFINLGVGTVSFFGANVAINEYRKLKPRKAENATAEMRGVNQTKFAFHPLQITFGVLVLIAAWCIAESWRLAHILWVDWTKAKEAVPFIGKAWGERSRKRQEAEEAERKSRRRGA